MCADLCVSVQQNRIDGDVLFGERCYAGSDSADPVYRPVGYDVRGIAEVALAPAPVHFARPDQAVQQRSPLLHDPNRRAGSFAAQTDHPQRIFSDVIVRLSPAIICIVRQRRPLVQGGHANAFASSECRDRVSSFTQPAFRISTAVSFFGRAFGKALLAVIPLISASMAYSSPSVSTLSPSGLTGCEHVHIVVYGGREPNRRLPLSGHPGTAR